MGRGSVGWARGVVEMIALPISAILWNEVVMGTYQSVNSPATYMAAMTKMMWNQEYYLLAF
jgi:hypothetical protein